MLCTDGPQTERQRRWILKFEDRDRGDMHFDNESDAMRAWNRLKDNWTCTLFVTADFVAPPHWTTELQLATGGG